MTQRGTLVAVEEVYRKSIARRNVLEMGAARTNPMIKANRIALITVSRFDLRLGAATLLLMPPELLLVIPCLLLFVANPWV